MRLPEDDRGDGEHDERDLPVARESDAFENGDAQWRTMAREPADEPDVNRNDSFTVEDVLRETGDQEGNVQQSIGACDSRQKGHVFSWGHYNETKRISVQWSARGGERCAPDSSHRPWGKGQASTIAT